MEVINTTVFEPTVVVVSQVLPGAPGPPGAPGGARYVHNQSSAASTWVVNHNLGYYPIISVLTPGGAEQIAEVVHASLNHCFIYFVVPTNGQAVAT